MEIKQIFSNKEYVGFKFQIQEFVSCAGSYQVKEDVICISHIISNEKGGMKLIIQHLISMFKTNKIIFYNVLSDNLEKVLKNFKIKYRWDEFLNYNVKYLEGVWETVNNNSLSK